MECHAIRTIGHEKNSEHYASNIITCKVTLPVRKIQERQNSERGIYTAKISSSIRIMTLHTRLFIKDRIRLQKLVIHTFYKSKPSSLFFQSPMKRNQSKSREGRRK